MSGQSDIKRTLISALAALMMSTVAVGSAVAPANVSAPAKYSLNA